MAEIFPNDAKMKPVMILPPDAMSEEDVELLRGNGFCVVIAKNPAAVKFLDAIPAVADRGMLEAAAIKFSRRIMAPEFFVDAYSRQPKTIQRGDVVKLFLDLLVSGTSLDPEPTRAEQERELIDEARADELVKIGREEAREAARLRKEEKAKKGAEKS